eukprot:tig00000093_g3519.t1
MRRRRREQRLPTAFAEDASRDLAVVCFSQALYGILGLLSFVAWWTGLFHFAASWVGILSADKLSRRGCVAYSALTAIAWALNLVTFLAILGINRCCGSEGPGSSRACRESLAQFWYRTDCGVQQAFAPMFAFAAILNGAGLLFTAVCVLVRTVPEQELEALGPGMDADPPPGRDREAAGAGVGREAPEGAVAPLQHARPAGARAALPAASGLALAALER